MPADEISEYEACTVLRRVRRVSTANFAGLFSLQEERSYININSPRTQVFFQQRFQVMKHLAPRDRDDLLGEMPTNRCHLTVCCPVSCSELYELCILLTTPAKIQEAVR